MSFAVRPSPPQRSVVLVTPDSDLRQRLSDRLTRMRWNVLPAAGGAEAMVHLGETGAEAMIVDHWLPDLDAAEFMEHAASLFPETDLLNMDGSAVRSGGRSPRRDELLHTLREAQEEVYASAAAVQSTFSNETGPKRKSDGAAWLEAPAAVPVADPQVFSSVPLNAPRSPENLMHAEVRMHLPEVVGDTSAMRELARLVRLVAPHSSSVLIQGETGTGKELIAKAVHRLSTRAAKPYVVLNCAAIPEQLLEAELFGHTRGAFTGAVTSRTGRIEAAHGGTLFLDEIGEMPLSLQAKMLRFLENGEIQRVGENDTSRVDVRIVAATHQPLQEKTDDRLFRLDLYHRLAVFPVFVPPLRERREDIPMLVEYILGKFGANAPKRSIQPEALDILVQYPWDGNVRELGHVLQRAAILCGDAPVIGPEHLRLRSHTRRSD